ncbi:DUF3098 domain-containing protein [Prevotella amnii]|jgi:hypothetical protein|uniref:Membrane protein n=2 Tax=Prevotella amnii TaxID=419005 RepID=A0A096B114_9BACT|nr:DUF3098 domain-containing protein [Prevotella amnii]EFN91102.1 hypothetical protein HMPREF9018_0273 [Prevotella amnii CRIS 21A-A]KGF52646.1 membrane protein [Prevotella amnii DNF00058]
MEKQNFAFDKANFILLAIGVAIVVIGFILMSGSGSGEHFFNVSIFSFRRITLAPIVTFIGFVSIIGAILYKPKKHKEH